MTCWKRSVEKVLQHSSRRSNIKISRNSGRDQNDSKTTICDSGLRDTVGCEVGTVDDAKVRRDPRGGNGVDPKALCFFRTSLFFVHMYGIFKSTTMQHPARLGLLHGVLAGRTMRLNVPTAS